MASLAFGIASIGLSLALRSLLPGTTIEGPGLSDLSIGGNTHGEFIPIGWGTDERVGVPIDTPELKEVIVEETSGGKGGGPSVTLRVKKYFYSGRISFGISGATDLVQLKMGDKLIFDGLGTGATIRRKGTIIIFYPGGAGQIQDPEEIIRRGVNVPAYRHLTTVKIENLPLEDWGNVVLEFRAVTAYASSSATPFIFMDNEPASLDPPGDILGASNPLMQFDPVGNRFFSNTATPFIVSTPNMDFLNFIQPGNAAHLGRDGFIWSIGTTPGENEPNSGPISQIDADTGLEVNLAGNGSVFTATTFFKLGRIGARIVQLNVPNLETGIHSICMHEENFNPSNGALWDATNMITSTVFTPIFHVLDVLDEANYENTDWSDAATIPDHTNGRFFHFTPSVIAGATNLHVITFTFHNDPDFAPDGFNKVTGLQIVPKFTFLRQFTSADFGGNTGIIQDWAINEQTSDLILRQSGGGSILYNPDSDTIIASTTLDVILAPGQFFNGPTIARAVGGEVNGSIEIFDTRTLELQRSIDISNVLPGKPTVLDSSMIWSDVDQSVIYSRVDLGADAAVNERIVKVFSHKVTGKGELLSTILTDLSTTYQNMPMARLEAADVDVSGISPDPIVEGFTINRSSTGKQVMEPLRNRYSFDVVVSDWKVKFVSRGSAPVATILEDELGRRTFGNERQDNPPVNMIRKQDLELPMRVNLRYRNKNIGYSIDVEHTKRIHEPFLAMRSLREETIDLSIADIPADIKQRARQILFDEWAQRVLFDSYLTQRYLALDPTDIFLAIFNGKQFRIRMTDQTIGASFDQEFKGVVENETLIEVNAQVNLGHVDLIIPSTLSTRLIPMDAPALSLGEVRNTNSNGYIAGSALEDAWPGYILYTSGDNITFVPRVASNIEVGYAKVNTPPTPVGFNNVGDFPNRFQEVADGGTMVITVLRRDDLFMSAADDLAVYNGANAIGIKTSNGMLVIQFADSVDNGDGTLTLSRLLRGRGGTEDLEDLGGPLGGQEIVLLSNETGVRQTAAIQQNTLSLTELNNPLFMRGVTDGTIPEEAQTISFTYTGRDLRPYTIAQLTAVLVAGDLTVNWFRRARGIFGAEWLDGTGTTPLNETAESYTVTLNSIASGDFTSKVVLSAETVMFTSAEIGGETIAAVKVRQNSPIASQFDGPTTQTTVIG